jgi:hypothetical protein
MRSAREPSETPRIEPVSLPERKPAARPRVPPAAPTAPAAPAAPAKVLIEVQTEPAGADVAVDGKPGCSPTPCTISAERDALLKIQAELSGHRPGSTELRADDEHKLVKLSLKKRVSAPRSEPGEGELMIPDAFARPRRR